MNSQNIRDTENLQQDVATEHSQEEQNQKHISDWIPDIDLAAADEAILGFLGNLLDGV